MPKPHHHQFGTPVPRLTRSDVSVFVQFCTVPGCKAWTTGHVGVPSVSSARLAPPELQSKSGGKRDRTKPADEGLDRLAAAIRKKAG